MVDLIELLAAAPSIARNSRNPNPKIKKWLLSFFIRMRERSVLELYNFKSLLRNTQSKGFSPVCALNTNARKGPIIVAVGCVSEVKSNSGNSFEKLRQFRAENPDWLFGYFSYDLKNEIEKLSSYNSDEHGVPDMHFFIPELIFITEDDHTEVLVHPDAKINVSELGEPDAAESDQLLNVHVSSAFTKDQYVTQIRSLQNHIQLGNIYEVNFCNEFAGYGTINPIETYFKLNEETLAPFSAYYKQNGHYLLCGSPERFIKKEGNKVVSQPIKGTAPRGINEADDEILRANLLSSEKERAENIMITDLVRNDLSKNANNSSVHVDELCGAYSYKTVHQLVSTVGCTVGDKTDPIDIIKGAFPMGSMTGAPKVRAMELIEEHESFKRGIYSGSVGYFKPNGDFDFNVVIRSILYNEKTGYISCPVGGAITAKSDPEKEYEETLVKAQAMLKVLGSNG